MPPIPSLNVSISESEQTSRTILAKLNQRLASDEATSGHVPAHYLGYLLQNRHHNTVQAAGCNRRCLVLSETAQLTTGYYVFATTASGMPRGPAIGLGPPVATMP